MVLSWSMNLVTKNLLPVRWNNVCIRGSGGAARSN